MGDGETAIPHSAAIESQVALAEPESEIPAEARYDHVVRERSPWTGSSRVIRPCRAWSRLESIQKLQKGQYGVSFSFGSTSHESSTRLFTGASQFSQ